VALVCLPVIAFLVFVTPTVRPDLFDLVPAFSHSDGHVLLAWGALERAHHALNAGEIASGTMIRALGYMMEGDRPVRDGERVSGFILLPDAGNAWHPPHRFGDEMIDVQLEAGSTVRFAERSLVWAWGTLRMLAGDPNGHKPLYRLDHARTEPAAKADIGRYFR
jgi:hypothetical protein